MNRAWIAVVLVASGASAADRVIRAPGSCLIEGVTKDGRYLTWTGNDGEGDPEQRLVVRDLISGAEVVLSDYDAENSERVPAGKKWREAHPLVAAVPGRTSPDKSRVLGLEQGAAVTGAWVGDEWSSQGGEWTMVVTHDGKASPVASMSVANAIDVFWTPDGKHTLFVAHHSGHGMRDPGYDELIIGTDGNPAVGLAVDKSRLKDAEKIAGALGKTGFTVVSITPAQKAREKSVVFAAAGSEADAQRLAAAVPGGATVEKMGWKSPLPLVIALGPAALK